MVVRPWRGRIKIESRKKSNMGRRMPLAVKKIGKQRWYSTICPLLEMDSVLTEQFTNLLAVYERQFPIFTELFELRIVNFNYPATHFS